MRIASRRPHGPVLVALLLGGSSGCHADLDASPPDAQGLSLSFPDHAATVLHATRGFTAGAGGFTLARAPWRLGAVLPQDGASPVRFQLAGDHEVRVREVGAAGAPAMAGHAVTYRRPGGTSYWTVGPSGVEEWLHLEAGAVRRGEAAAAWEIEGGTPALRGSAVVVETAGGRPIWVTAPAAFAASGHAVAARLAVRGDRIELYVDGGGEEVLVDPAWTAVPPMSIQRFGQVAVLLPGGAKVLVAGGLPAGGPPLAVTETYDVATDTWTESAAMADTNPGRFELTATLLANGLVLVTGGESADGYQSTGIVYDATTDEWANAGTMSLPRYEHTATLLQDGRVLVAGGNSDGTLTNSVDLYDPTTSAFTATAPMISGRAEHTATLLPSGKVLVAGGDAPSGTAGTAEIYDPVAATWTAAASMNEARANGAATLLGNGKVLVVGGNGASAGGAELYDPGADQWTVTGPMVEGRSYPTVTMLGNGTVLAAGGVLSGALASTEVYDPVADTWTADLPMISARFLHTATALPSGEVLVTGGNDNGAIAASEIYGGGVAGDACALSTDCAGSCDAATSTFTPGTCVSGACASGVPAVCAPYACGSAGCFTSCTTSAQCASSDYCDGTACVPLQSAGTACSTASQCASGFCADSLCCDQACTGLCDACSASAKTSGPDGTCGARKVTCPALEPCQDEGSCSPTTGTCANVTSPDGSPCTSDGSTGACSAGTCILGGSAGSTGASSSGSTGAGTGTAGTSGASSTSGTSSSGAGGAAAGVGGASATGNATGNASGAGVGGSGGSGSMTVGQQGSCSSGRSSPASAPWALIGLLLLAWRGRASRGGREVGT